MDLSKVSTKDLEYINAGQFNKVSTAGLEEIARQQGTPARPSASVVDPVPYNKGTEVVRSIASGAMLNWADELEAALRTGSISNEDYIRLRDQLRGQQAQFKQDNPVTGTVTELGGAMALPIGIGMGGFNKGAGIIKETALGGGMGAAGGAGRAQSMDEVPNVAATDALLGGGLTLGFSGASRLAAPSVRPEAVELRQQSIPLTPGSAFGGRIQRIEQSAESIPVFGNIVSGARERQFEQFNAAAYNKVLKRLDPKLEIPQGLAGREAYNFVEEQIKGKYQEIIPKLSVNYDKRVASGFQAIKNRYSRGQLSDSAKKQLDTYIDGLEQDLRASQAIPGFKVQAIKQDLAELANTYAAGTGSSKILGNAFKDLEGFYMSLLRNQNPRYAGELRKADNAFVDFVRVQNAMAKTRGDTGVFSPAQLDSAVRQSDSTARKGAFARGGAPMQDLSSKGVTVLGQKVSDSGTAGRGMTAAALTGGVGYIDPLAGSVTALLTAPYYKLGEKALFAPRPENFTEAVKRARGASPFAVPGILELAQ